ncbi:hypothetical protein [Chitinophaga japonensis]|uniref:Uncharacterized protein n=1 Tax=Chitinophaga japonensis TaxID=104662 RepID=A0A562SZY8_CHIJA|nr:hypothetical protein [Chitinophaga japonensis]TWI86673.1 hypothetical protein LX66_3936 [Chitinophaga japonensis]
MAKEKNTALSKRILTDPSYARTRENMEEFSQAGKAGKLLRDSLRALLKYAQDARMSGRLSGALSRVIKSDTVNDRGKRTVTGGDLQLLQGFEFNKDAALSATFLAPHTASIDRATGVCQVDIAAFVPVVMIAPPLSATHFQLVAAASELDLAARTYVSDYTQTAELVYGADEQAAINLSLGLPANSAHPLFLVLGIKFYQEVNGKFYQLYADQYNASALVKIDQPAAAE